MRSILFALFMVTATCSTVHAVQPRITSITAATEVHITEMDGTVTSGYGFYSDPNGSHAPLAASSPGGSFSTSGVTGGSTQLGVRVRDWATSAVGESIEMVLDYQFTVDRTGPWHFADFTLHPVTITLDGQTWDVDTAGGQVRFDDYFGDDFLLTAGSHHLRITAGIYQPHTSGRYMSLYFQSEETRVPEPAACLLAFLGVIGMGARKARLR